MSGKVVLDTNCLLMAISSRSRYYPVWQSFLQGEYTLCVTTDILEVLEKIDFPKLAVIGIDRFLDEINDGCTLPPQA